MKNTKHDQALVLVKQSINSVDDARTFFTNQGIDAKRLLDHAGFVEADNEFCYRVKPGEVELWSDASHMMRRHLGWGYQPTRHSASYEDMNLDNVYRLSDLWESV